MLRPRILLVSLACLAWLSGCSIVNLAYDNATSLIADRLEDAFALTEEQSAGLQPRLDQLLAWHRSEELPRYRDLLDEAATRAVDGISAAEIIWLSESVRLEWHRLLERTIDCCGDLAVTLTREQIAHFARYHREASEDFDDYLRMSLQQREIYREDQQLERLEKWFGDLDYSVERRIRARLQSVPDIWEPWLRFREARQREVLRVLTEVADGEQLQRELKYVLLSPDSAHAREFEPPRREYWRRYAAAIEDISSWLSPGQHRHAVERLRDYAQVVTQLAEAN